MSTYSEYPVFEPNQVLSYTHLNGLVDYLEKQDRLTRRKLIGIGIACGLKVSWKTVEEVLHISKGAAVTSEGYLLCLEEDWYDQYLPYTLPELAMEESNDGEFGENTYTFLQDEEGNTIDMWEMLPTDFMPEEGEEEPETLTRGFLEDKVIMLFLECERESLRNCDINDCSDKGARMTFEVRVLAINEADAIAILDKEKEIANRPVHLNAHPKHELDHLDIEKINPSRYQLHNFEEIYLRVIDIFNKVRPQLSQSLKETFDAYKYLLKDVYPEANFPSGPFTNFDNYLSNVHNDFAQNLISLQYLYDFYYDIVQTHNEFLHYSHKLTAECFPNEDRFPKHVLLGWAYNDVSAYISTTTGDAFDPLSTQTGLSISTRPLEYRHYFIPSMIHDHQGKLLHKIKSLHYRLYLSAFRYDTAIIEKGDIRITPSKDGDYQLSDKAIPFYYTFNSNDDFHTNWSFEKSISNRLDRVFSYQFTDSSKHPLLNKMDGHNFYRIEGHVGKGLATVLKDLSRQKKELGLSFAIEPVFIGITGNEEADERTMKELIAAARPLFMCKMRDLDVIFLILIAMLFFMLYNLLLLLSRIGRGAYGMQRIEATEELIRPVEEYRPLKDQDFIDQKVIKEKSKQLLKRIRKEPAYLKGTVVDEITKELGQENLGNIYLEVNAQGQKQDLYTRTHSIIRGKIKEGANAKKLADEVYPVVALMDNTEELLKSLSIESVAHFDFQLFEYRYKNFVDSYELFVEQEPLPSRQADKDYLKAKAYAEKHRGQLATNNTQSLLGNINSEFSERFYSILSEMTLPGFAKKHPGLEHKAGVPRGGTFVPVYANRNFVINDLEKIKKYLKKSFELEEQPDPLISKEVIASLGNTRSVYSEEPKKIMEEDKIMHRMVMAAYNPEPLDNFIVVGDFCIPHQCCDGDCSDIFDQKAEPVKSTLRVTVLDESSGRALTHARVAVMNTKSLYEHESGVDGKGTHSFELDEGTYRIGASALRYEKEVQTRIIKPGQHLEFTFELQPTKGMTNVPEILDGSAGYDIRTEKGREAANYYGHRYKFYDAYSSKLDADAITDNERKLAEEVRSSMDKIMSGETDLNKLNREVKRVNNALAKIMESTEEDREKAKVNESIKVVNSAYLDKLSLISPEDVSTATKNAINELENTNKKTNVDIGKTVKEWSEGFNLSEKPKIVENLKNFRIKKSK